MNGTVVQTCGSSFQRYSQRLAKSIDERKVQWNLRRMLQCLYVIQSTQRVLLIMNSYNSLKNYISLVSVLYFKHCSHHGRKCIKAISGWAREITWVRFGHKEINYHLFGTPGPSSELNVVWISSWDMSHVNKLYSIRGIVNVLITMRTSGS